MHFVNACKFPFFSEVYNITKMHWRHFFPVEHDVTEKLTLLVTELHIRFSLKII